tara:strand:- start:602 stop:841 length:240 start_codon:yes stop_codon:yes gene_type:complete
MGVWLLLAGLMLCIGLQGKVVISFGFADAIVAIRLLFLQIIWLGAIPQVVDVSHQDIRLVSASLLMAKQKQAHTSLGAR